MIGILGKTQRKERNLRAYPWAKRTTKQDSLKKGQKGMGVAERDKKKCEKTKRGSQDAQREEKNAEEKSSVDWEIVTNKEETRPIVAR